MDEKLKRMRELISILTQASRAYYQESREIMSNFEYDRLYDELLELEKETGTVLAGILARSVYTALVAPLIFWIMKKMQSRSMGLVESGLRLRASRMRSDRKE